MATFKNKNSLTTIEAQIVQKLKNNEARPKFTGSSYKKKASTRFFLIRTSKFWPSLIVLKFLHNLSLDYS